MNIRDVIFTTLSTDSTVGTAVKSGTIYKISPIPMVQQWTAPYITYQQVSEPVSIVTQARAPRYQISVFHTSAVLADSLAEAVRTAMKGINGNYNGISVAYAQLENKIELYDETSELNYYILDYRILHSGE